MRREGVGNQTQRPGGRVQGRLGRLPVHDGHLAADLLDELQLVHLLLLQRQQVLQDDRDGGGGRLSAGAAAVDPLGELGHSHPGAVKDLQGHVGAWDTIPGSGRRPGRLSHD